MNLRDKITQKSPQEAYNALFKNYPLIYIQSGISYRETKYVGFDISEISEDKPVAEVILLNEHPVQVRLLREPRLPSTSDFKFGGF